MDASNPLQPELDLPTKFQASLVIDYESLGESAGERLKMLIDVYQAVFEPQQPQALELLTEYTNWSELDDNAFEGIFMMGLEQLLLDLTNLPIQRYLTMQSFNQEALLRSLVTYLQSPRLT